MVVHPPGFGLLEEFRKPFLYKWDLKNKKFAAFEKGIRIPLKPFCGVLGVAPKKRGFTEVGPPGRHGGNMDIRHLTAGSWVEIPVWVDGRPLLRRGRPRRDGRCRGLRSPPSSAPDPATLGSESRRARGLSIPGSSQRGTRSPGEGTSRATGIGPDLMEATKESVRNMIDYLTMTYGLTARRHTYSAASRRTSGSTRLWTGPTGWSGR